MLTKLLDTIDCDDYDKIALSKVLSNLESLDESVRTTSIDKLIRIVAPWEIVDGQSTSNKAEQLIRLDVQHQVIPILVYLLKEGKYADKTAIIELLHDLYRLDDMGEVYGFSSKKWGELKPMTQRIRSSIRESKTLLEQLSSSSNADLKQISKDMLSLMGME